MSAARPLRDVLACAAAVVLSALFFHWVLVAPAITVIIVILSVVCALAACAVGAVVVWLIREYRADRADRADAERHLAPLRRPTPAEATLTTDLRQRRMLLRPRGLSERAAVILATRVARTAGHRVRQFTVAPEPAGRPRRPALSARPAPRHAAPMGTAVPSPAAVSVLAAPLPSGHPAWPGENTSGGYPPNNSGIFAVPSATGAMPEPQVLAPLPAPLPEQPEGEHRAPMYFPQDVAEPEPLFGDWEWPDTDTFEAVKA